MPAKTSVPCRSCWDSKNQFAHSASFLHDCLIIVMWRCLLEQVTSSDAPGCAAEKLTEEEARAMLQDLQLGAPADGGPLVGLLSRWAARGRQESPEPQVHFHPLPAAPCHLSELAPDAPLL